MNILNKIFRKDELVGYWSSDDGSGFVIIMGSWIEFYKTGKGKYESWSNGTEEDSYNYKGQFDWQRIGENQISITSHNSENIELIEYSIKRINKRYELTSKQKSDHKGFWHLAETMLKK